MQIAQIEADYSIAPAQASLPELPERGAVIKLSGCGLCGSDLEKFTHKKASPGTVLGHEVVGIITHLADDHNTSFQVGDRLVTAHHTPCGTCHYCRFGSESMCRTFKKTNLVPGGFSEFIALTREHLLHTAFKVPDRISDAEASCMEPLACVLKAIDRLSLQAGQSVLIVGLGFIGLLAAQVFSSRGVTVLGTDLSEERMVLATAQGWLSQAVNPKDSEALASMVKNYNELGQVDAVFLTVANANTVETAFNVVRDGGQLLLFASASQGTVIDPSTLYYREINALSSYSPSLAHLAQAAQMIFNNEINVKPLITATYPLSQIAEAMASYQEGQEIKILITPDITS